MVRPQLGPPQGLKTGRPFHSSREKKAVDDPAVEGSPRRGAPAHGIYAGPILIHPL